MLKVTLKSYHIPRVAYPDFIKRGLLNLLSLNISPIFGFSNILIFTMINILN